MCLSIFTPFSIRGHTNTEPRIFELNQLAAVLTFKYLFFVEYSRFELLQIACKAIMLPLSLIPQKIKSKNIDKSKKC